MNNHQCIKKTKSNIYIRLHGCVTKKLLFWCLCFCWAWRQLIVFLLCIVVGITIPLLVDGLSLASEMVRNNVLQSLKELHYYPAHWDSLRITQVQYVGRLFLPSVGELMPDHSAEHVVRLNNPLFRWANECATRESQAVCPTWVPVCCWKLWCAG